MSAGRATTRSMARRHLHVVPAPPPQPRSRRVPEERFAVYCSDGEIWQTGPSEDWAALEVEVANVECNFQECSRQHTHHPIDPDDVR